MQLLDVILQRQLASDEAAVVNVLNVLSLITPSVLSSSTSQRLWIARINTLLERPKHYGARWAGLCLAHRTALLNRELLVGSAQTWISFALPLLSRDEPIPTMVSAIHLLVLLYTSVKDMPEFHRQVIAPTLQKFSIALLQLVEKPESTQRAQGMCWLNILCILIMQSLCVLIHEHPTLHIALQGRLHSVTLAHLSGTFPSISDPSLVQAAADVHSVLHLTGGKVRAAAVWRKSVDSAVTSAGICLHELTSASRPTSSRNHDVGFDLPPLPCDEFSIPLAMDRLKCLVTLLIALLRCPASRPITVPVGSLVKFAIQMISVSSNAPENPVCL
ncbi:hypothetical protein BS47DRAFT_1300928 [Hydnum rufescens UP504]|uniref:Pre-rRNA-processing protein RIX1 n=1 Tax=Hydnum rufescens UP504 TaxID=1448309 RepID=A0A9P6AQ39_9AGAM|nr:hypothetical protein BS47DRAFT_1300928 [Hydnum rufescens UP504]